MIEELRKEVNRAIEEKKVDLLIGYRKGTIPLKSTPLFIKEKNDVDSLIFDETCSINLSTYLRRFNGKIGIVAKGCDGRSAITMVVEKQIKRENLLIIGVVCNGVIDLHKVYDKVNGREILEYSINKEKIFVKGRDFEQDLSLDELLSDCCKECEHPTPPIYDVLIGEEKKEKKGLIDILASFKKKSPDERWEFFSKEISRCMRCYACREVCPACICEYCIVDRTRPQWFGKSTDPSDTMLFHLVRIYHTAGRCVDCGACTRACPFGIDLRLLNKRLQEEIYERFGFKPGLSMEVPPPFATYNENDEQEFIM